MKPITKLELAEMFDISLEQFEKEFQDGIIIYNAEDEKIIVIPTVDKPLKMVYEGITVKNNEDTLEINKELSDIEKENLLNNVFGTTNIGMINCISLSYKEICNLMRDATLEEQKSVQEYIESNSEPTGINFNDFY